MTSTPASSYTPSSTVSAGAYENPLKKDYYVNTELFSAAYVLLTTLVLADLLGADKFTNAFGLLLLFQGVATFIGPPVVGAIFDQSGSYNGGFILMGGMISLSGLMLYPIPYIQNRLRQEQQTDNFLLS